MRYTADGTFADLYQSDLSVIVVYVGAKFVTMTRDFQGNSNADRRVWGTP